jgi:hypothetical protein
MTGSCPNTVSAVTWSAGKSSPSPVSLRSLAKKAPARLSPGPPTTKLRRVVSHPSPFLSAQAFERPPNALFIPFRALWPDRHRQFPPVSLAGGPPTLSLTASLLLLSDRQSPPLPTRAHQASTSLLEAHFIVCHLFASRIPLRDRTLRSLIHPIHHIDAFILRPRTENFLANRPRRAPLPNSKREFKNIRSQHGFNSATTQQHGCCQS